MIPPYYTKNYISWWWWWLTFWDKLKRVAEYSKTR